MVTDGGREGRGVKGEAVGWGRMSLCLCVCVRVWVVEEFIRLAN